MMEGSERERARRRLADRPLDEQARDGDTALTDLGLVNRVAHRKLGFPEDDEAGVADAVAALTLLRHLREELAEWEPRLIAAARAHGASWIQLAPALGVASRQAAERRYLRLRPDDTGEATTGEQRVRAERDRRAGDRAVTQWARNNAIGLRQLAAQVSALDGDGALDDDARKHVDTVTAALGESDTAALLGPLTDALPHLHTSHPGLADKIAFVTDEGNSSRQPKN
ncbi:HSP18 transcriptional regulator [Kutzneria sp. NPDC051319]|uniref:HSP18 transcriptional regulator n=1 Tax=Kutzneria sp. NPDC051319 TaxID=3155047 RepID=UPI00341DE938